MTTRLRNELNRIEKFLLKGSADSARLWNVLSALRGPDVSGDVSGDGGKCFTIRVRRNAFPKLIKNHPGIPAQFDDPSSSGVLPVTQSRHFDNHIRSAFAALGLK